MNYCILGCGKIARTHARILRQLAADVKNGIEISFASRSLEKAAAFQKEFGGRFAFASYEEALRHPQIDVIVLCTPNDQHHAQALEALDHGKHLIIEKPLTCSVKQADEILAKARTVCKTVLVAENHRYRPSIRKIEQILASGDLGVLKMIRMQVMRTHRFSAEEWRASAEQMGGGPLIDGGIHWVNALLTLGGGEASEIRALEPPVTAENCPREDTIVILCRLANGAVGSLHYSWGTAGAFPLGFLSVHGSKGSLYVANTGMFGVQLTGTFPKLILMPMRDWKGYKAMWEDFVDVLQNNRPERCLCLGEIGRRDVAFVAAAYESATPSREAAAFVRLASHSPSKI